MQDQTKRLPAVIDAHAKRLGLKPEFAHLDHAIGLTEDEISLLGEGEHLDQISHEIDRLGEEVAR